MARALRLSFENAVYHITARGIRRENIFHQAEDKGVFLDKMNETFRRYAFVGYAYCLLDNHYHLFLKTPHANLTAGMHYLNASYANWFRAKYQLAGSIFQGRYKSILVDENSYALKLSAYIHLNPLRAGIADDIKQYKWSSYPAYTGEEKQVKRLDTEFILGQFDQSLNRARKRYATFVRENINLANPLNEAYKGIALGSAAFIDRIEAKLKSIGRKREIRETRHAGTYEAEEIIDKLAKRFSVSRDAVLQRRKGNIYRLLCLYLIKKHTALGLREIGDLFGMDYAAVSQACRRFEKRSRADKIILGIISKMEKALE